MARSNSWSAASALLLLGALAFSCMSREDRGKAVEEVHHAWAANRAQAVAEFQERESDATMLGLARAYFPELAATSAPAGTPNLTYTPANDFVGQDTFTFKVNDGLVDSAPATVSINITDLTTGTGEGGGSGGSGGGTAGAGGAGGGAEEPVAKPGCCAAAPGSAWLGLFVLILRAVRSPGRRSTTSPLSGLPGWCQLR